MRHPETLGAMTVAFLLVTAGTACAQMAGGVTEKVVQQEMNKRELQLRAVGGAKDDPAARQRLQLAMQQVQQNFEQILKLHNQIVKAIKAQDAAANLDYEFVAATTGEIRRRASQLQKLLLLPETGTASGDASFPASGKMTEALALLCLRIKRFVTNPVIDTPGTTNAEEALRASRDLELVVEMSGKIKKEAEKRRK